MQRTRRRHTQGGFTLIELLVVIAIIGILAAILIPNFWRSRGHALVSASKSHMRGIANALESYYVDNGMYPPTGTATMIAALQGPPVYVKAVPRDPCTKSDYVYTVAAPDDYTLATVDLSTSSCAGYVPGNVLYYRPGSGLSP